MHSILELQGFEAEQDVDENGVLAASTQSFIACPAPSTPSIFVC